MENLITILEHCPVKRFNVQWRTHLLWAIIWAIERTLLLSERNFSVQFFRLNKFVKLKVTTQCTRYLLERLDFFQRQRPEVSKYRRATPFEECWWVESTLFQPFSKVRAVVNAQRKALFTNPSFLRKRGFDQQNQPRNF